MKRPLSREEARKYAKEDAMDGEKSFKRHGLWVVGRQASYTIMRHLRLFQTATSTSSQAIATHGAFNSGTISTHFTFPGRSRLCVYVYNRIVKFLRHWDSADARARFTKMCGEIQIQPMPIDAYLNVDDVKKSKFYGSARKKPKRRRSNNNSNGHVGIHSTDKSSQELSQIIEKNNGAKTEYEALTMDVIRDGRMARMVCDCGADISIGPNAPRIFEGHLRSCGHCPICGGTSVKIYISITVTKELKLLEWLDGTWG